MIPWPCSRFSLPRSGWEGRGRGRCVSILSDSFSRGVFALTRTKFSLNSISYMRAELSQPSSNVTGRLTEGGGANRSP